MGAQKLERASISQYLALEEKGLSKYEYADGQITAMTGGSINHGLLCGNIYSELRSGIERQGLACNALGSEIRIYIEKADAIVYPDAMVICGDIATSPEAVEAVTNPILVVEVLSKSTESHDRGDKFYKYRQLDTLQEYMLIDQSKAVVETFYRRDATVWEIARFMGLEQTVELKSIALSINMRALYSDVRMG